MMMGDLAYGIEGAGVYFRVERKSYTVEVKGWAW